MFVCCVFAAWGVLLLPWAPRKASQQWTCALFQTNSVKFVHRNPSLWWVTGCWAEEQSTITRGECSLGMQELWHSCWECWLVLSKCQLTALSVSRVKNISIRLSWGAVGLFNPAKDSVSRGFDAEGWVDVFKLNLSETERLEAGTWEREVNKMSFSERVEGFLGNSRISETAFWKPHPSSAPKTFSVPVTFTELSVKRGWLQQQIKVSKTS